MRSGDDDMPGHKVRHNKDGTVRHGWAARHDLVKLGYQPKWVRLHYSFEDQTERLLAAAQCRKLQAEMLAWASGMRSDERAFDGTVASLVCAYQRDPASPYSSLKWNTRRTYDQVLGIIEKAFGQRSLVAPFGSAISGAGITKPRSQRMKAVRRASVGRTASSACSGACSAMALRPSCRNVTG